jgi:hypothetical protein
MCSAATCRECGKASWRGCGRHVDQVLRGVPAHRRCTGHASPPKSRGGSLLARVLRRSR